MENQLKATELRIENFINDNNNFTMQVVGLFDDEVLLNFEGNEGDVFVYTGKQLELLKPIHLTEDILVKLGFKKTANPRELKYGDYSILLLNEIRFVIYNYMENPPSVKVSTVHQLQNLFFALTGEELTFKN